MLHRISYLFPVFVLLLVGWGCDRSGTVSEAQPIQASALPTQISAHTEGVIGDRDPIFVMFKGGQADPSAYEVSFDQRAAGEWTVSNNSLRFDPSENWLSNTRYVATVTGPQIDGYQFTFRTEARQAELVSDGFFLSDADAGAGELRGRLLTTTQVNADDVRSALVATHEGQKLDIEVSGDESRRVFSYIVKLKDRGADPRPVAIVFDGEQVGFAGGKIELKAPVPGINDFEVLAVEPDAESDGIVIQFSKNIDPRQDFSGIVSLSREAGFTTRVEGNRLFVYPQQLGDGKFTLELASGLLAGDGETRLTSTKQFNVQLTVVKPELRTVGNGMIVPYEGDRVFAFEAVGLRAVYLEILEIFPNNILQYLQEENFSNEPNDWSLRRVGKVVVRKKVTLSRLNDRASTNSWSRYALDLDAYIRGEESAIYQIRLGFGMEDVASSCGVSPADFGLQPIEDLLDERSFDYGNDQDESRIGKYPTIYGNYSDYTYRDRDDICKPAYYHRGRFITRTMLSTNLGLIAKMGADESVVVIATDLINAQPRKGVQVKAYNYQQQELATGRTNADGSVTLKLSEEPTFFRAAHDGDFAYMSLRDGNGLALGRFDIGGSAVQGGVKGNFYAERGVWRPGDSVYLNFVIQDEHGVLPKKYPINFTLRDAQGRTVERKTVYPFGNSRLYPLWFTTGRDDVTGNWSATVDAGGRTFVRNLMIETVKPNRLTVDLRPVADKISPTETGVTIASDWLYGAPASGLRAKVDLKVMPRNAPFAAYESYTFQDPARRIQDFSAKEIFDGQLDTTGEAVFDLPIRQTKYPGPVQADLGSKVFEPGGNFSIGRSRLPFDPYEVYAGVDVPLGQWGDKRISRNGTTDIPVVSVGLNGQPVANRKLSAGVYRLSWRYWWQDNNDNVGRWNASQHTGAISKFNARTNADGRGILKVSVPDWGRYLIRVCDEQSGHCTGEFFYAGYNNDEIQDREQASLLQLRPDETSVEVGKRVNFTVPSSEGANILVSLETSEGSIRRFWVAAQAGQTKISFETTQEMVPTVYATVQILQPYRQTTNDRPVRLFGVQPFEVKDPSTVLEPRIATAEEYRPQSSVDVTVSERNGKRMTYTLAVVDEGLLGLTRFKTPDLHAKFYAKEALNVRTHDLYAYVMGSLNGEFGKVLAIGGGEGEVNPEDEKANRFKPVVRFLGPFELPAGRSRSHAVDLPNYVGAVRVMVVGSSPNAYGSAEERVPVVQPLMVIPTLPRVLGPGERVDMPVTVVAMEDGIRGVDLEVSEREGLATLGAKQQLRFSKKGEQLTYIPVTLGEKAGVARFDVRGNAGKERASQEIEIDVRHPNSVVYRNRIEVVAPGQSPTLSYENFGTEGTREATLELSTFPSLALTRHLRYLLRYPYGCVEQTTSTAFAQIHLSKLMELDDEQKATARGNVLGGLLRMREFQTNSGGMAYWPGRDKPHPWASNYVLHFLAEAKVAGFAIPGDVQTALVKFQRQAAQNWSVNTANSLYATDRQLYLDQAYRLYALAISGYPEIGAMNRLRQDFDEMPVPAQYQLMAAYATLGRENTAKDLLAKAGNVEIKDYRELGYTFGSSLRDAAVILSALTDLGDTQRSAQQAFRLAETVNARSYLNTQEAAWVLVALSSFADENKGDWAATVNVAGMAPLNINGSTAVSTFDLPVDQPTGSVQVKNTGGVQLYANVIRGGRPRPGEEEVETENLKLRVRYLDAEGNEIDVSRLASGTDFVAEYQVSNPGTLTMSYRQIALETLLPSGWEVRNDRMRGANSENSSYDYQDFRDDRVYTFFDLDRSRTKTFRFAVTATYPGRFYLPAQRSTAMYADDIKAGTKGQWVEVTKSPYGLNASGGR